MPKYIFVTGGVVSSLGKGLAASSIGAPANNLPLRLAPVTGRSRKKLFSPMMIRKGSALDATRVRLSRGAQTSPSRSQLPTLSSQRTNQVSAPLFPSRLLLSPGQEFRDTVFCSPNIEGHGTIEAKHSHPMQDSPQILEQESGARIRTTRSN